MTADTITKTSGFQLWVSSGYLRNWETNLKLLGLEATWKSVLFAMVKLQRIYTTRDEGNRPITAR